MRIAFIGFGEAARAFVDSLPKSDLTFAAYDILLASAEGEHVTTAARSRHVALADNQAAAAQGADWIISAVTAASSLEAAGSAAPGLKAGQLFIDINSVSPGRKRATAEAVAASGAAYLDMAVMAPVHPAGHRTPTLIAGVLKPDDAARLKQLDFHFEKVSDTPGDATAIKMVRSLFVKGLEAITAQTLAAARASGCSDRVIASIERSFPGLGWPAAAAYAMERVASHGVRRAAEMRECATFMEEIGVGGELARAIAGVQDQIGALRLADHEKASHAIVDTICQRLDLIR